MGGARVQRGVANVANRHWQGSIEIHRSREIILRKRKDRQGNNVKRKSDADGPVFTELPFSRIDHALLGRALSRAAVISAEEFPKLLEEVLELLRQIYPPNVLAVASRYASQFSVSKDGIPDDYESREIKQHHVEILQVLTLTLQILDWGQALPTPADFAKLFDLLPKLADAFSRRRWKEFEHEQEAGMRVMNSLQERMRLHTQIVRNWGYFFDVIEISTNLYGSLDEGLERKFGFTASDVILVARALVELLEVRSNERMAWLRSVFSQESKDKMIEKYFNSYSGDFADPTPFLHSLPKQLSKKRLRHILLMHADLSLEDTMIFKIKETSERSKVSEERVSLILDVLSFAPGQLRDANLEYLFMSNPVWTKPLISFGETYFCPAPTLIFSYIHDLMAQLADQAQLKKDLELQKAKYLESSVKAVLNRTFSETATRHGIEWVWQGVVYETDHLVQYENVVLIVEDKSAAFTAAGLRGAPDRLRRHVSDLIIDPSIQSQRLEKLIALAVQGDEEAKICLGPFHLDIERIKHVVRVVITLHDVSAIASAEDELKDAGLVPEDVTLAPVLSLSDLKTVCDILESPIPVLHYLLQRNVFQKSVPTFAFEIDFLGLYLETGLNIPGLSADRHSLVLTGMSSMIDKYYISAEAGVSLPKPKLKLSPYFQTLIEAVEKKKMNDWSSLVLALLSAGSFKDQVNLEKALDDLRTEVIQTWQKPEHRCAVCLQPDAFKNVTIAFFLYPPELSSIRKERAVELAGLAIGESGSSKCFVICRDTGRWNQPYSFILMITPDVEGAMAMSQ